MTGPNASAILAAQLIERFIDWQRREGWPEMTVEIEQITDEIEERDGLYFGQWRRPVNEYQQSKQSIHDDETAQRLGLRGGTVAGTVHLELFPPLLLKAFGTRWFERGNISIYFLDPTRDREEVRAVLAVPPEDALDAQVAAWIERPDSNKIGAGTAAVGNPSEASELLKRDLDRFPAGELRILAGAAAGDVFPELDVIVPRETVTRRLEVITDPLPWYEGESPWGGTVVPPAIMASVMTRPATEYLNQFRQTPIVGLFGATELRNVNGPMLADTGYRAGGRVVNVGQTPRTEYLWYEAYVDDRAGLRVAEMRMMTRLMKASSPLYQDQ